MVGSAHGFELRSQRYAMVVEDGRVRSLSLEEGSRTVEATGAEALLAVLDRAGHADRPADP